MKSDNALNLIKKSIFGCCLVASALSTSAVLAQETDIDQFFQDLQDQGLTAEEVILQFIENGIELEDAAGYTVGNADSIGLSIAYAQAAICLSPDQARAVVVGQQAVDNSTPQARNAVQASVTSTLSTYAAGECELLLDERNNAAQAFAAPGGDSAGSSQGGGGAPPDIDLPDGGASPSQ